MARVEVYADRVVVRLTTAEKALALRTRDIVVQRSAITSVVITNDPWVWLRGVRSPGTHIPGRLALGSWRSFSGTDFALIRKGKPAVILDLELPDGVQHEAGWVSEYDHFARVILSSNRAAELISALKLTAGDVFTASV